ncbi:MAG: Cbb3-type cytochrome oxidase subunit 3 CcoP [Pseudomonadota bacterium]
MSDFFSAGWSIYIAAATVIGLLSCLALLLFAARRRVMAGDNTTGHVWDEDLRELNNPLPRWWMWLFVLTVVFAVGYLVLYPGLGSATGRLNWTSANAYQQERATAQALSAPLYQALAAKPVELLARDPQAVAVGERLFANNCATCHGSDARGSKSFPNLSDADWLWGGTPDRIKESITLGRRGAMPPMAASVGTSTDVTNLALYVLTLSGWPNNIQAQAGQEKFVVCASCHGRDGKGNQAMGAPNLTDKIWLHGRGKEAVIAMVNEGKTNVMPAHEARLTPEQIHVLTAYVWGLSNPAAGK